MFDVDTVPNQQNKYRFYFLLLIAAHSVLFAALGLSRHWGYLTSIYDLGCFDQVVWSAANGLSLINTSIFDNPVHWLGFHFQPLLYFFVPFYKAAPSVNWFIIAQSIALAIAAWPIYLITEQLTRSGVAALIWGTTYLCNPFLLNAASWDFHPVTIAVPFMSFALLAVEKKHPLLLLGSCLVIMCCKEHFGLAVAGFGVLYWIRNGNRIIGSGLIITGTLFLGIIIGAVMPALSPAGWRSHVKR